MGKLLDPQAAPPVKKLIDEGELEIVMNEKGGAEFTCGPRMTEITRGEWLDLLIPPHGDRAPIERLERRLQTRFPGLPWTPFLWGLDSI